MLTILMTVVACFGVLTGVSSKPPTMTIDPKVNALNQYEKSSVTLSTTSCSDPDSKTCSVSLQNVYPSSPCGTCFSVLPCGNNFCLRYFPDRGVLNPASQSMYQLTLKATDQDSESTTNIVEVLITTDAPPYFDYNNSSMTFSTTVFNAKGVPANDILYTVNAKDPEGGPLTYTMTTSPKTTNIRIDSLTGDIITTKPLGYECHNHIAAQVTVQDTNNSPVGPFLLDLYLSGANAAPVINNLNNELRVREDQGSGSSVLSLAMFDDTPFDGVTYTMTSSPTSGSSLFEIVGNDIRTKAGIDYESQPKTYTLTIKASDGYCDSETYTLTVKIVDVNEPPKLYPLDNAVESCEGLVNINPKWNVTDPDIGDVVTFTDITPNTNGRLKINPTTGIVSTTLDYDLDVAKLPSTVISTVKVTDRRGLTATATLTIRFVDCNDNPPVFSKFSQTFQVRDCDPPDTVVGSVVATDKDSIYQQNNVISYYGSGSGATVQPGGSIVLTSTLPAGTSISFPVYAKDKGQTPGPLTCASPEWVSIFSLPCITEPPVTKQPTLAPGTVTNATVLQPKWKSALDSNLGWVVVAALLGALLTGLLLYMLFRYCWWHFRQCWARRGTWCKRRPPPRLVTPMRRPTPPQQKEQQHPGFIFGWWKETFTDSDYKTLPDHNTIPEPSHGPELQDTNTYDPVVPPTPPPAPPPAKSCIIL